MAENLKYNAKGSKCGNGNDNSLNDANTATCDTYGRVYNWSTAMNGVCPEGWHLPSDAEWTTLTNSVGGETTAGTKLKANSPLWNSNGKGTDDYGFSALPGGRYYSGTFGGVGFYGDWWSATEYNGSAYSRDMFYGGDVHRASSDKTDLYSVRCVRDKSNGFVEPSSSSGYAPIEISNFTFSDIKYWVGSGSDSAMLIIQWNDGKTPGALAYGYRWEKGQEKTGNDMIIDIAKADKRLFYLKFSDAIGRSVIGGIGFSASGEAKIGIDGVSCKSPVNGSVETSSYNFDSWKICDGADARWFAGWSNGYWSYWTSDNTYVLNYSDVEVSSRVLKNKSIDAWNAAPDMKNHPLSTTITPVSIPSSSSVEPSSSSVEPSSSSVEPSSSSVEPSSSSVEPSSSSSEPEPTTTCNGVEYDDNTHVCDTRDNKLYKYVTIGTQTWMAENLNFDVEGSKCYAEGVSGVSADSIAKNCTNYGKLYNWATAMNSSASSSANPSGIQGICPSGWHLPSTNEWEVLTTFVGDGPGGKLKANSSLWSSGTMTDNYGFAGLPGGFGNADGSFNQVKNYAYFWSATETEATRATEQTLRNSNTAAARDAVLKETLRSVRCVKN